MAVEPWGSPFVGRSAEMRVLSSLVATVMNGGPAGGMVIGTPGLGKSRLLSELVGAVDLRCVRIQGYQTARGTALAAAGGLLRELAGVPEFGDRLDGLLLGGVGVAVASPSIQLFEIAFRCVARIGPLGIVADDLQWIDRETLALLHYLVVGATSVGSPLFVVCAGRPAPESASFARQLAAALPAERFRQLELGALDERDGLELLTALAPALGPDRASKLWRSASGSPFWMTAFAADLASGQPVGRSPQHLIDVLRANLSRDPTTVLALLVVAAQPMGVDGLGEVLGWPEERVTDAVSGLVDAALALEDSGRVWIAHDLIRETAWPELGDDQRRRMNSHLAGWLEASAGDDVPRLSRALEHRVASGLDAYDLALRIARSPQRRRVGADGLAVLAGIADSAAGEKAQALQREVAALAFEIGDWATAWERWSVLADRLPHGEEAASAALAAAAAALKLGRSFEVHALAGRARALDGGDPVFAIEADCVDAQSLLWLESRVDEAQPYIHRAMARAESLPNSPDDGVGLSDREAAAYVKALRARLDAAIRGADAGTVRHCAEMIQRLARDPGEVLAAASDGVFSMLQFEGLPRSAEPRAKRALEESRRLTMPGFEVEATHWAGWIAYHLGRLGEASATMAQAVALAERVGAPRRFTLPQLKAVLHGIEASRTDWQSNVEALGGLIATEPNPHFRLLMRTIHLGLVGRFAALGARDLDPLMDAMASDAEMAGCGRCLWESVLQGAEASARIGPVAVAEQALRRWDAAHTDLNSGGPAAHRAYVEALIASREDAGASIDLFARAARDAEDLGYRLMRLWIDFDSATTLARIDRRTAIEQLERVTHEAEEMGAASELQLATAALRRFGVHTWRRGPGVPLTTLTPREHEIAEAVAHGATNPEIANSLFLSRKTVERHVSNIFTKLNVRNRAELAAAMAQEMREFPDDRSQPVP